ncbi:MAG: glycosyltransferase family 2 protein [Clostridia bacterium]|nr:glycosyltransferase family 2 protein [Clostridia bacterium]
MLVNEILICYAVIGLLIVIIYLPKLVQFFSINYKPEHRIAKEKRRISIVIPALNESAVIEDLLRSIEVQTYDRNFFDVNVIVKEDTDPTIQIAERYGARVFVVPEQTCKGGALDGYFKRITRDEMDSYDAFVIVDADGVLAKNYVEELNNALEYNIDIYLSRKDNKNNLGSRKDRTVISNCSSLIYAQLDDLGNRYRMKRDTPMNMCGQGMMIRRRVIEEIGGWPYRTVTEDYELRMDCFIKDFTSMYYPDARIYTEEPTKHKECFERRVRWLTGFSQCDKKYKKPIAEHAKKRGYITEGEFEYFFCVVPLVMFIVLTALTALTGAGLSIYFGIFGSSEWIRSLLLLTVMPLAVIYLFMFIYVALCMIAMRDVYRRITVPERIAVLFFGPIFELEYFPIYVQGIIKATKNECSWSVTEHTVHNDEEPSSNGIERQRGGF